MTPLDYLRAISQPTHRAKLEDAYVVWRTTARADVSVVWWPDHGVILWQTGVTCDGPQSALSAERGIATTTALQDGDLWRRPGFPPLPFADLVSALPFRL